MHPGQQDTLDTLAQVRQSGSLTHPLCAFLQAPHRCIRPAACREVGADGRPIPIPVQPQTQSHPPRLAMLRLAVSGPSTHTISTATITGLLHSLPRPELSGIRSCTSPPPPSPSPTKTSPAVIWPRSGGCSQAVPIPGEVGWKQTVAQPTCDSPHPVVATRGECGELGVLHARQLSREAQQLACVYSERPWVLRTLQTPTQRRNGRNGRSRDLPCSSENSCEGVKSPGVMFVCLDIVSCSRFRDFDS